MNKSILIIVFLCLIGTVYEFSEHNFNAMFWSMIAASVSWQWGDAMREWKRTLEDWENDLIRRTTFFTSCMQTNKFVEIMRGFVKTVVDESEQKGGAK